MFRYTFSYVLLFARVNLKVHKTAKGVILIVTGEQLRGARAMVRIEQSELASRAGVSIDTVKRLERTLGPISANVNTVAAISRVLEAAGVEFIPENGGGAGVRLRARSAPIADQGKRPEELNAGNDD